MLRCVAAEHWDVDIQDRGRCGFIEYREGAAVVEWEFGGGDVVVTVMSPSPLEWDRRYPWAAGRQRAILERIGTAIIERKAHGCRVDFDPRSPEFLYIRKPERGHD
jgi:hypothetical protein